MLWCKAEVMTLSQDTQVGQRRMGWISAPLPPSQVPLCCASKILSRDLKVSVPSHQPSGPMTLCPCTWKWTYSFGGQSTKTWGELDEHTVVLDALHKTNEQHSRLDFWEALGILATLHCGDQSRLPTKDLAVLHQGICQKGQMKCPPLPSSFSPLHLCHSHNSLSVQINSSSISWNWLETQILKY